jgi:hypothetical protein
VIADTGKHIKKTQQKADNPKRSSKYGFAEKEQLRDRNHNEHSTHEYIHSSRINTPHFGILVSSGLHTMIDGQSQ